MTAAQTIAKAAAAMREQNIQGRGYMDDTFLAVADWLQQIAAKESARESAGVRTPVIGLTDALAIANSYLGDQ